MIPRAALALAAVLVLTGRASAAPDPASYSTKAAPLDDFASSLLTGNGYVLRDDGTVWDSIGETAVLQTDMPYLLSRLASAKRLRALLQINNIITRYDSANNLTSEDKEAVRTLVRDNWVVFGLSARKDFRSYFSLEELEPMDQIPPRYDTMSPLTMTDPEPESVTGDVLPGAAIPPAATAMSSAAISVPVSVTALPPAVPVPVVPVVVATAAVVAPAAAVAAPAVVAAPVTAVAAPVAMNAVPTLTPLMALPSLQRGSPFAPAAAPAAAVPASSLATPATAPTAVAAAPAVDPHHSFVAEPAAPPPPVVIVAPPVVTISTASAALGTLKAWTPPPVSTTTAAAPPKPAQVAVATAAAPTVAAAPPPPPPAPKPVAVGEADYEAFVAGGPYTKEGKDLLTMIEKRAPDFVLPLLRRTVVGAVPQIVVDGARTGSELRAGFSRDAADPMAPPIVALSPGPVFVQIKKSLFGKKQDVVLPESERAWTELGVARPALDAMKADPGPATSESGDWGEVRVYADGSRRGAYTNMEQAGELLEQLLLLGLTRENLDASPYAARRWARTGRLMLEARLKDELKQDNFLDPDRRAELRDWLDHPDEADDLLVAAWGGSRVNLLDPRRGPPEAARDFETRAKDSCPRSALEDALVEASRRRARAVGALENMVDAGVVDGEAAKAAAQAAADAENAAKKKLLDSPPACAPADAAHDEGLRKAALLLAESSRAERLMRDRKAGIDSHAL